MPAYACRISEENRQVIASENPHFNLEEFQAWMSEHEDGYFIRDDTSVLDCEYLAGAVFEELYVFERGDEGAMFRRVHRL